MSRVLLVLSQRNLDKWYSSMNSVVQTLKHITSINSYLPRYMRNKESGCQAVLPLRSNVWIMVFFLVFFAYIEISGPEVAVTEILAAGFHHHILLQHHHSISCKCQVKYNLALSGRKQFPTEYVFQLSIVSFCLCKVSSLRINMVRVTKIRVPIYPAQYTIAHWSSRPSLVFYL